MGPRCVRHLRCALHLFRRHQAQRGQPAPEVRRSSSPAHRRQRAVAGAPGIARTGKLALPLQVTETQISSRDRRSGRHSRRHGLGRADGARQVRAGRRDAARRGMNITIFPEYDVTSGITVESPDGLFIAAARWCAVSSPIAAARSLTVSTRSCPCPWIRIRCSTLVAGAVGSAVAVAKAAVPVWV